MTFRYISTIVALLSTMPAFAADVGPHPAEPAVRAFDLGEFRISSLSDGVNIVPNDGPVFGADVGPKAVSQVLKEAGQADATINLSVDALLARRGRDVVLLDAGLGPAVPGALLGSLGLAGVTPDAVTTVLITHVHDDHVGGLVTKDGRSTFSKAKILISEPDWKWLRQQPEMADLCKILSQQVKTFSPGDDVVDGIKSIRIAGHTPGHVGFLISSNGQTLLDVGDTVHSSIVSLAKPDWAMGYDNDRDNGRISRKAILAQLVGSRQLVFAPHFPFLGVGLIVSKSDHFEWMPKEVTGQ
jgi:glyoxylase-like metal-dependent hydrolase (beta-lactamase superfamily II)